MSFRNAAPGLLFVMFSVLVACFIVDSAIMFWRTYDRPVEIRGDIEHKCEQANERVLMCAMRIHKMEQEIDMLRLRIEELEDHE